MVNNLCWSSYIYIFIYVGLHIYIYIYVGLHIYIYIHIYIYSARNSCQILMKRKFSRHIFEQCSDIKFHENPFSGSRVVPCGKIDGQTD